MGTSSGEGKQQAWEGAETSEEKKEEGEEVADAEYTFEEKGGEVINCLCLTSRLLKLRK